MDWIINDEMGLTVGHVVGWAAASAMVIGGVIPYVPQYLEIKKTQDADGFSLHVCFALLIANSLRILFWFSKRYELPLLVQSVVMNVTMFLMIHLCVKVKRVNANARERRFSANDDLRQPKVVMTDTDTAGSVSISTEAGPLKRARSRHYLSDLDMKYFWYWTDFQSYLDFMLVVWAVGAAITYLMLSVEWFMEIVGFVAVFTEAMLGAPQFIRNFKNKSTYGMSIHMVLMWTLGDMFKTGYFIARNAPSQFWICGTLQSCKQHRHHQRSRSTDYKRHGDFQNHWTPLCVKERSFRRKQKRCPSDRHRQYQRQKTECSSVGHLPNTCTKSSLDSSDDPKHLQNHRLSSSTALHEIAIEIDAATMTEDNTTTATSNFAFKGAAENALVPIIRAPLHVDSDVEMRSRRFKRRSSVNSNTTAETDELSNEEHDDNCYRLHDNYRVQCGHCHCCDHTMREIEPSLQRSLIQMRNECVKIKRKRFIAADDYCSSCSRCSSCSCSHIHTSSCSSFEEWPLDERQSTRSAPNPHAFTVSADCHHCNLKRRSIASSTCELNQENRNYLGDEVLPQPLIQETSDSSGRSSRRSSVSASFCSCTSNTCCCCDDTTTGQMCTARDVTLTTSIVGKITCTDGEEQHSSTLTPLTNPSSVVSTPVGDDGEVTIRSLSQALTDDTSSQSHSADYYSLSSNQQQTQDTPCKTSNLLANLCTDPDVPNVEVIDTAIEVDEHSRKARRPCKHFSKHHRHKRPDSPTDSYL